MFGLLVNIVSCWFNIVSTAAYPCSLRGRSEQNPGTPAWVSSRLLQVINPNLGNLQLLLECCGDASDLAQEAANMLNSNQYTSPIEDKLKKDGVKGAASGSRHVCTCNFKV